VIDNRTGSIQIDRLSYDPVNGGEVASTRSIWDVIRRGRGKSGGAVALAINGRLCDVLRGRRRQAGVAQEQTAADLTHRVLKQLAARMMARNAIEIMTHEALEMIEQALL
jgi:hypothetical protein